MKKIITLLLLFVSVFTVAGCGSKHVLEVKEEDKTQSMVVGQEITITLVKSKGTVEWASNNESIVTVSDGKITAVSVGIAKVTVSIKDSDLKEDISVTVIMPDVESVSITGPAQVVMGTTANYSAAVLPSPVDQDVTWSVDDQTVAKIDATGKLTPVKVGTVVITATSVKENTIKKDLTVAVVLPDPSGINITGGEEVIIGVASTYTAVIDPALAVQTVTWSVDNETVATISENGVLTPIKVGTVVITATSTEKTTIKSTKTVQVKEVPVESVVITGPAKAPKDFAIKFSATVTPSTAEQSVTWSVDNETNGTIDQEGNFTGLVVGTVVITATSTYDETIKHNFTVTVDELSDNLLVDQELTDDAIVVHNDELFIEGVNAFNTLSEISSKLVDNVIVYIKAGTYTTDLTIAADGVKFIGPNEGISAVDGERGNEAIIKAKLTISGVDGFTLDGVSLQDKGQLYATTPVKNVVVDNVYGYDHNVNAAEGVIYFGLSSPTDVNENITVTNTTLNDSRKHGYRGVRVNNVKNITITDNYFWGFYDTIRLEGNGNIAAGLGVSGFLIIEDNEFEMNIQYPIMVTNWRAESVEINNNYFAVDPDGAGTYGFVYLNGYAPQVGLKSVVNIKNNFMPYNTEWHEIRVNSGGATASQLEFNVNYNVFNEIPAKDGATSLTHIADHNTTITDFRINGRENIFMYEDDVLPAYFIRTDYEPLYRDQELIGALYVNEEWSTKTAGDIVNYNGINLVYGQRAFSSIAAAYNTIDEGGTIYLTSGTYTEALNINKDNLKILSQNYNVDPNLETRFDEAILTGTIKLAANLKNFEMKGLKFTGNAKVENTAGSAGTASNVATNMNGFKFMYNVVESNLASGKGFIHFVEAASSYSRNLEISYNEFSTANSSTTLDSMIYIDNNAGLRVVGNAFVDIKANAFYVNDVTKGLAGDTFVQGNLFQNIEKDAFKINWLSPLPGTTMDVKIVDNEFESVSGISVFFGRMNNTDIIKGIYIQYNTFDNIHNGIFLSRVHAGANFKINYNIFNTVPGGYYIKDEKHVDTVGAIAANAENNLYLDGETVIETPLAAKFEGGPIYTTKYTSISDVPLYPGEGVVVIEEITLTEMSEDAYVGDNYQFEVELAPDNATMDSLVWESSDLTVATVEEGLVTFLKAGTVTIKVYQEGNVSIFDEVEIEIVEFTDIDLILNNDNGVINVDEEVQLNVVRYPSNITGDATFTSLTPGVATISSTGLIKGITEGEVVIEVKVGGLTSTMTLIVKNRVDTVDPIQFIMDANINLALVRNINTFGNTTKTELTAGAVSNIWFDNLAIKEILMAGRPKTKLTSLEFVVIHDTGNNNLGATAQMHSNYLVNNTSVSWHYTVDQKEAIRHIPHDEVGYHAGDGLREFGLTDTGVTATTDKPEITINNDGYYVLNGTATTIAAPLIDGAKPKTSDITPDGIFTTIQDGKYFINNTYYNSTYKVIANHGGGSNGIGIESAVDQGSDLYATWQNLAQLVAYILDVEELGLDRVMHHNNFSGKNCPQTLRTASLTDQLRTMIKFELEKRTTFKDYTFSFVSNNPNLVDNSGKIIKIPNATTEVSYTVNITNNSGYNESVTLYSTIPGMKTLG